MKYTNVYTIGTIDKSEAAFYEKVNPGFVCTGETLTEAHRDASGRDFDGATYVVMRAVGARWTRHGMCRDCGDHYIIARYDRYDSIDKATLTLKKDVDDR